LNLRTARLAIAHDWLLNKRGAERLLKEFCLEAKDLTIFTLFYDQESVDPIIRRQQIFTSYLNGFPGVPRYYRYLLPWFQSAARHVKITGHDLLISISHAVSKNFLHDSSIPHICYCLTPMRYVWCRDLYEPDLSGSWKGISLRLIARRLQQRDLEANHTIDFFVAISKSVQERIRSFYGRQSDLIYPCIDHQFFRPDNVEREDFFLAVSALVPQKRLDRLVNAFNSNGKRLLIVGTGPERQRLARQARANIRFLGWVPDTKLRWLYQRAQSLIVPASEEFGLVSVEAQACGCPVIACSQGGLIETIIEGRSGILFDPDDVGGLQKALGEVPDLHLDTQQIVASSRRFSRQRFWADWNRLLHDYLGTRQGGFAMRQSAY